MTRCLVHLSAVGPAVQAQDRGRHDGEEEDHGAVRLRRQGGGRSLSSP